MQRGRVFRMAAIAWLVTAIARVVVAVVPTGPADSSVSVPASLIGAAFCAAVAALLWFRPTRSSAIVAIALGLYAVAGLAYAPLIGLQPWFVLLSGTGLVAFALSVAAFLVSRRAPVSPE